MIRCILITLLAILPAAASAHGDHGSGSGLMGGLLHPLTGFDHLLIMLAAGLLAARWTRSNIVLAGWAAALLLGYVGGALWPAMVLEGWMVAGLLAVAAAVGLAHKAAFRAVPALLAGALFAQGLIHGAEAPPAAVVAFGVGFLWLSAVFMAAVAGATRYSAAVTPRLQQVVGVLALAMGGGKLML